MYRSHDYEEKLDQMIQRNEEKFPIDLDIDFVEVSPRMEKTRAKAHKKPDGSYYIRVSKKFIETHSDERIELTVIHEMVHIYFYRQGFTDHGHGKYFRWVLGRVGGSMTNSTVYEREWRECIEPFLKEEK